MLLLLLRVQCYMVGLTTLGIPGLCSGCHNLRRRRCRPPVLLWCWTRYRKCGHVFRPVFGTSYAHCWRSYVWYEEVGGITARGPASTVSKQLAGLGHTEVRWRRARRGTKIAPGSRRWRWCVSVLCVCVADSLPLQE